MAWLEALGNIAGALIGAKSQRRANESNEATQREFAQHGIRWRVEDAKAAGLHPLYALGGGGATYSPAAQPVFDGASLGQNLSRAAKAFSTSEEQALRAANIRALEAAADKDFAAASAYRSEAARNAQAQTPPVAQSFPVSGGPTRHMFDAEVYVDGQAPQFISGVGGVGDAGIPLGPVGPKYVKGGNASPMFQRFQGVNGEVLLPTPEASEALESMENLLIQAYVAGSNYAHYKGEKMDELRSFVRSRLWSDPVGALQDGVAGFLNKYRRP